jgi:hypothetical protein
MLEMNTGIHPEGTASQASNQNVVQRFMPIWRLRINSQAKTARLNKNYDKVVHTVIEERTFLNMKSYTEIDKDRTRQSVSKAPGQPRTNVPNCNKK